MRLVFFGTPAIAVPTLEALVAGPHEVVGVVSQPDRPRGRGRRSTPSPVSQIALATKLPLLRPEKVGDAETVAALRDLAPDLGVVVAFGQFIPKSVRELPGRGYLINAHASLLPKYRGAAPIARAILEGERETGISVMRIVKEMDAGPVGLVRRIPIGPTEDVEELSARLADLAAEAIVEAVDRIDRDEIEWTEQDASRATFAEKIGKADAVLDLREPAEAVAARIHAVSPRPGGSVTLETSAPAAEPVVLKISRAETRPFGAGETPTPGTLDRSDPDAPLRIATGSGWLVPLRIQKPGGRALPVADFLRGFTLPEGARCALLESTRRVLPGAESGRGETAGRREDAGGDDAPRRPARSPGAPA